MDLLPANVRDNLPAVTDPPVLSEAAQLFADQAMAENTKRTYRIALQDFYSWCEQRNLCALPADPVTVANYAADLATAGKKASTIKVRMVAIRELHKLAEMPLNTADPTLTQTLRGIWRTIGVAQHGKAPLEIEDLRQVIEALPEGLRGVRNRAILLVGWAGALRRSELAGLDVNDLEFRKDVLIVTLRHSKTDQNRAGQQISLPWGNHYMTCPVRAVQTWIQASAVTTGPLFRGLTPDGRVMDGRITTRSISNVVKGCAMRAGLSGDVSAHSLRAGFATSAAVAGKPYHEIQRQTRHKSMQTLLGYIRAGDLENSPAAGLGL